MNRTIYECMGFKSFPFCSKMMLGFLVFAGLASDLFSLSVPESELNGLGLGGDDRALCASTFLSAERTTTYGTATSGELDTSFQVWGPNCCDNCDCPPDGAPMDCKTELDETKIDEVAFNISASVEAGILGLKAGIENGMNVTDGKQVSYKRSCGSASVPPGDHMCYSLVAPRTTDIKLSINLDYEVKYRVTGSTGISDDVECVVGEEFYLNADRSFEANGKKHSSSSTCTAENKDC